MLTGHSAGGLGEDVVGRGAEAAQEAPVPELGHLRLWKTRLD